MLKKIQRSKLKLDPPPNKKTKIKTQTKSHIWKKNQNLTKIRSLKNLGTKIERPLKTYELSNINNNLQNILKSGMFKWKKN
jgi:hypothetical protein